MFTISYASIAILVIIKCVNYTVYQIFVHTCTDFHSQMWIKYVIKYV